MDISMASASAPGGSSSREAPSLPAAHTAPPPAFASDKISLSLHSSDTGSDHDMADTGSDDHLNESTTEINDATQHTIPSEPTTPEDGNPTNENHTNDGQSEGEQAERQLLDETEYGARVASELLSKPSRKRKQEDDQVEREEQEQHASDAEDGLQPSKKAKLDGQDGVSASATVQHLPRERSLLPAEIWHYIFTFCPPKCLGLLMGVNKLFRSYLDPSAQPSSPRDTSVAKGVCPFLHPSLIWKASRRTFWPCMPSPLQSKTELDMWRLTCSLSCQHCGQPGNVADGATAESPSPGPGMDRVSIVWPFGTRSCGSCLLKNSLKEIDLLLSSSTPSALMPAFPFVLLTDKLHAFSATMAERGEIPSGTQFTKIFWKASVETVKKEFLDVQGMGLATTEEWLKGLEGRGVEQRQDYSRWEKWASSGSATRVRSILYPGYQPVVTKLAEPERAQSSEPTSRDSVEHGSGTGPSSLPPLPPVKSQSLPTGIASLPPRAPHPVRHERTKEEVAELKAARIKEIERRAMLLDPPIQPGLLAHIPSFQAATQIITPLDDNAWELLKPRLLAQRADAEEREKQAAQRASAQQATSSSQRLEDDGKDVTDSDWDEIQGPVRAEIARLADEIIRDRWEDGEKVGKDNCAEFAVSVLLHVRKNFYAGVAKEAAAARSLGKEPIVDPPRGPFTQKLTLENMKWVFDVKIRPHTEALRKELFFCNGCEGNFKYYGFEGVIQHYAAKHTSVLSMGSIVVHWRAEWPETPPFHPNPRHAKQQYHQSHMNQFPYNGHPPTYNPYQPGPPPPSFQPHHGPPYPAGPYGAAPAPYPESYPAAQPPSYPPPITYGPPQPGFAQALTQAPPAPYQSYPAPPPPGYPTAGYGPQPNVPPPHPVSQPPNGAFNHNFNAYQANGSHPGYPAVQPQQPSVPDRYRTQLDEVARLSRDLWNSTASIKDLPSTARLQVIIYHVAKRFHAKFSEPPSLAIFIDGLSGNKDMRPVRNVNGLQCKVCHTGHVSPPPTETDLKSFSMPQLANHFQIRHIEPAMNMGHSPTDWTADMILLPDLSSIAGLRRAANSDSQKFHLLSEALPQIFQVSAGPVVNHQHQASVDKHDKFYGSGADNSAHLAGGRGDGRNSAEGFHSDHVQQGFDWKNRKKRQGSKGGVSYPPRRGHDGNPPAVTRVAEEDAQRDEEAGRAMWASDRAHSAHLPHPGPHYGNGAVRGGMIPDPHGLSRASSARPGLPSKPVREHSPNRRLYIPEPTEYQPPNASDREGSDPLAALELYLDQERNRGAVEARQPATGRGYIDQDLPPMPRDRGVQEPPQPYRRATTVRPEERGRSRSPVSRYARYVDQPVEQYRQRSPPPQHVEQSYRHQQAYLREELAYEQPPPAREFYQVYGEERRTRQPVEYELVRARDEQGEYYIRRPVVRREAEPEPYYGGAAAVRREASYAAYEQPTSGHYPPSAVSRQSVPPMYESRGPPPPPPARATPAPTARADSTYFEEYDPRYPAAASQGAGRHVRY